LWVLVNKHRPKDILHPAKLGSGAQRQTPVLARAEVPMFQSPPADSFANIEVYSDYSHHHDGTADGSDH
jgi:hypothetical protein